MTVKLEAMEGTTKSVVYTPTFLERLCNNCIHKGNEDCDECCIVIGKPSNYESKDWLDF